MNCYAGGVLIGGGGGSPPPTALYDEEEAQQTTVSAVMIQVPNSQLVVTAGNWILHYSIEVRMDVAASLAEVQVYNTTTTTQHDLSATRDTTWKLFGGVKYLSLGVSNTIQWQFRRAIATGNAYVRRARLIAVATP